MAKRIVPKQMWFITRRVMWREMRLRPSPKLNAIFNFVVALVAKQRNVDVVAMCVMSNHWHAVVAAHERNASSFLQKVHSELARAINGAHADFGSLWDTSKDKCEPIEDDAGVICSIAYTMANPVVNGGVKFARNWPGIRIAWPAKDKTFARARPFYRTEKQGGKTPATVVRQMKRPFGFEGVTDDELAARIAEACERKEQSNAEEVVEAGGRFRKRSEILRVSRYARATSRENHFDIRRRIYGKDDQQRAERLAAKREWDAEYDQALTAWRDGDRDVVFPYGTYKMVVLHNANMAPRPLPET